MFIQITVSPDKTVIYRYEDGKSWDIVKTSSGHWIVTNYFYSGDDSFHSTFSNSRTNLVEYVLTAIGEDTSLLVEAE